MYKYICQCVYAMYCAVCGETDNYSMVEIPETSTESKTKTDEADGDKPKKKKKKRK